MTQRSTIGAKPRIPAIASCKRAFERLWYASEGKRTQKMGEFEAYTIFREGWKLAMYHAENVKQGKIKQ